MPSTRRLENRTTLSQRAAQRRRQLRRRRLGALALAAAIIAAASFVLAGGLSPGRAGASRLRVGARIAARGQRQHTTGPGPGHTADGGPGSDRRLTAPGSGRRVSDAGGGRLRAAGTQRYAVGLITLHLVEPNRTATLRDGQVIPRELTTFVRYPAAGRPEDGRDLPGAPPAAGPFPLIVFGHGFDISPNFYAGLLRYWTSRGFVVAAPEFPLEKPNAPGGGPDEDDLPNQPGDMTFLITKLLAMSAAANGPLSGLINSGQIAVAGQSDGGDTALAVAYDPPYRDPLVRAAVILSGAEIPMLPAYTIAPGGPPLLATQGTADNINPPSATYQFYDPAPPPKFLLLLLGAGHLPPYSSDQAALSVVERVSTDFLRYYLQGKGTLSAMEHAGQVPGVASLQADP